MADDPQAKTYGIEAFRFYCGNEYCGLKGKPLLLAGVDPLAPFAIRGTTWLADAIWGTCPWCGGPAVGVTEERSQQQDDSH